MDKLVVIGAGAAGVFGAINAKIANPSLDITILEGSRRPLTKVKISGGGRCNVTHACFDPKTLIQAYPRGSRELLGAFHRFQPKDLIQWYKDRGVLLKTEKDGRMFPQTNSSQTIIDCLMGELAALGIHLKKGAPVKSVRKVGDTFDIQIARQESLESKFVLLSTGSSPVGHELAVGLGHSLKKPVPSLFTFNIQDPLLEDLAGQSFGEAELKLWVGQRKKPFRQAGPLLITHWGLSGPAVLKLSAFAARELCEAAYNARLEINFIKSTSPLLPALESLRLANPRKQVATTPLEGLSKKFWLRLLKICSVDPTCLWNSISPKDLAGIAQNVSQKNFQVTGKGQFKDEFVTCGGVSLKEVDFRTMESKLVKGLYLAGEVLDIDGITGGFNFQNAWTGSWIAAQAMAHRHDER